MERFFEALGKNSKVAYGKDDVKKALEANAVDLLLVSESLDLVGFSCNYPACH